ncbi:MAG: O-antigen ligase family protein [Parcubacteria group bacterium]
MKKIISTLLYLFVFLLPFQTRWIYAPAFLNGGYFEYGTFSLYATEILLGIIVILSIIFFITKLRQPVNQLTSKPVNRLLLLVLLVLLVLLNCFLAINKDLAFFKLTWLILAVALFCVILTVKPDFKKLSWALILSGLLQSFFAIQQFIEQKIIANKWLGLAGQDPQTLGTPVVEAGTRWLRTFGTLPHPNMLAGFLLVGLFFIIKLYSITENKNQKRYLKMIFTVNFLAMLTALSRAAILIFALITILLLIFSMKDKIQRNVALYFAGLALFIFVLFCVAYPNLISSRVLSDSRVENISNTTRIEQYQEFWKIYKNNWIMGVGLGNYPRALSQLNPNQPAYAYQPIHNTYLLIIAELGVMGILLIGLFVYWLAHRSVCEGGLIGLFIKNLNNKSFARLACLTCLACLAFFDHFLWSFYFGIMLLSVVCALTILQLRNQ